MGEKKNINFQVDVEILSEFDKALEEFWEVTGVKPVKQESYETAFKDYIKKIKKQIEVLKSQN